ncbi:MAG: lysylphosphatidylglycerol synthase transmembrane domain-containing protein [Natrialbaceae archaeon]|nr:lysylphosphatidylglycerol synthase transmembrane domain-containing protein [Natrialbaceae archaeon]
MSDPEKASDVGVNTRSALKIGLGFAVGVVLVYLLGVVVGWERTLERLRMAQWRWVVVGCLSTVLCLVAWGKTWQIILRTIGVDVPFRKLIVTFFAATFANYVTPMGQAGGEPFIAYILSQDTSASYEESLASVVTTDIIRLLPFFTFGGVGVAYLILDSQLPARIERYVILFGVRSGRDTGQYHRELAVSVRHERRGTRAGWTNRSPDQSNRHRRTAPAI